MRTTDFFKEIKKVSTDCTLERIFDYELNRRCRVYEVILFSEPSGEAKALCEKHGFSIARNIWNDVVNDSIVARTVWQVRPSNIDDIEVAIDGLMEKMNENVIIASDQAMIDAGLIECTPREDYITLWSYEQNVVLKKRQWAPIMRVFFKPLKEDIKDEEGRVIEPKSTHKIGNNFYGAPINGRLDLREFLSKRGVTLKEIGN